MPVIGSAQRKCAYSRVAKLDGEWYVAEERARNLVLGNRLEEILEIHRRGSCSVSTVLDYSAKRGKHAITQALVAEGVTVTRDALQAAAKLGGPGVDLLLAGVREGDHLDMAYHDALHARLLYGEFSRAMDLLEAGVRPSPECYNALEVGAKRKERDPEAWKALCHPFFDVMLPQTLIEHFTEHTLDVILKAGRPIHIERTLEILKQRPVDLFPECLRHRSHDAIDVLRNLGLRMDEPTFLQIGTRLANERFIYRLNLQTMLDLFVVDSGQTMKAMTIQPLLRAVLFDQEHFLRGCIDTSEDSYKRARSTLLPYLTIMDPAEHLNLFDLIDCWAIQSSGHKPMSPHVTALMKHVIQTVNRIALEQLAMIDECPSP